MIDWSVAISTLVSSGLVFGIVLLLDTARKKIAADHRKRHPKPEKPVRSAKGYWGRRP